MDRLWINTLVGGIARYEDDPYYRVSENTPGNPWMAFYYIEIGNKEKSLELLNWVSKKGGDRSMTSKERFNAIFKREPIEKELKVLKRIDDTWYGKHINWDSSLFVDYFCDYYFEMYRESCPLKFFEEK